jgi:ATP-dependent DNA helicase RecG
METPPDQAANPAARVAR